MQEMPVPCEYRPDVVSNVDVLDTTPVSRIDDEIPKSSTVSFVFTTLTETMRLRQMLDLDQSRTVNQKSVPLSFSDLVWKDEDLFDTKWTDSVLDPDAFGKDNIFIEELLEDLIKIG